MKLAARFLTAMAIVSLAIVYVATRDNMPEANAATGTISALNVGTCYATDADAFTAADCNDGDGSFGIAGSDDVTKADPLYATYAVDPKTSAENPRAIIFNGDLLKISIKDQGRDKRTGVLYAVNGGPGADADERQTLLNDADMPYGEVIADAVGSDAAQDLMGLVDHDNDGGTTPEEMRVLLAADGSAGRGSETFSVSTNGLIDQDDAGQIQFTLRIETAGRHFPMAPIGDDVAKGQKTGRVKLFGFLQPAGGTAQVPAAATDFVDLDNFFDLDEDAGCIPDPDTEDPDSKCRGTQIWFRAGPQVPDDQVITVMYVYYETSAREEIIGGKKKIDYEGYDAGTPDDETDDPEADELAATAVAPAFVDEEDATNANSSEQKALSASVGADGEKETRNLYLRETGWFTGVYVGYVRLTDSNGNGSEAGDNELGAINWGRQVKNAADSTLDGAAVLGVESGPVTIKYRDTDGEDQTLSITIDTSAPTVSVDAPAHEFATRDASPNMTGTFTDAGSGLRKDSFKLYADNKDDADEDGNNAENVVFDLKVYIAPNADKNAAILDTRGYVDEPDEQIEIAGNYVGYRTGDEMSSPFGIVKASEVYHPETGDSSTYNVDNINYDLRQIVDAEDFDDGATSGEFDDNVRFTFSETLPNETFNNTIDFQAVVMDRAGNLGFSDSDTNSPRFIHEYGIKKADRKKDKHNVLGWYSRHILFLDLVDPEVREDESATGFFGVDDGENVRNDNGVMVVFDKPVSSDTVNNSTFEVTLDDGTEATVVDTTVEGKKVFLQLEEMLDPDAKPKVDLASGEVIRDLAGNSTLPREFNEIQLSDGILPTFTVSLSNGSGLLPPDYGPDKITKERITISIQSNESIQGAPKFAVLCENFRWYDSMPGETDTAALPDADDIAEQREQNNIAKYVSNRTGSMTTGNFAQAEPVSANIGTLPDTPRGLPAQDNCAYETPEGGTNPNPNNISTTTALQRGSNRWEYQWNNIDDLLDGKLTVVVTGRDRGGFDNGDEAWVNYGTATEEFTLDTSLKKPTLADGTGGEVIPGEDEAVSEPRPFVLVDFSEKTPVDVTMFEVDGNSVIEAVEELDNNRFVYWPEPLAIGTYTVKVEANDAANNTTEFQYKFTVRDRLPFSLNLLAGWNSISFPANPQDRALHAVFTEPEIDQVIGWDATNPDSPWRAATRVDGVWTTGEDYAVLNDIEARYGYWVHSSGFVTQSVKLVGKGARIGPLFDTPSDIPTNTRGWNFVGVVDVDGDQTEDNAGQTLLNSKKAPITASQYLGDYRNAYTWNNIDNKWQRMRGDGPVTIGTGIWVYYTKGGDVAP